MTPQQFEKLYTANEKYLKKTLTKQDIYDDDLFQDTSLALCEHLQDIAVEDFRQAFFDKYDSLVKRVGQREIECVHFSNVQLAALEIIDESQDVEILDRHIDYDLEQFTAECTIRDDDKERLQQLLDDYYKHPQPDERNHKRACKILKLYLQGKSEREIANKLKISQQAVNQSIKRTVERLKVVTLCKYYRGANRDRQGIAQKSARRP